MSKVAKPTCEDCYFHRAGLCALSWKLRAPRSVSTTAARSSRRASRASCRGRWRRSPADPPPRLRLAMESRADDTAVPRNRPPETRSRRRGPAARVAAPPLPADHHDRRCVLAYGIAVVLENNKHVSLHFVFATARGLADLADPAQRRARNAARRAALAAIPPPAPPARLASPGVAHPRSISAGETKLNASRADDGGPPKSRAGNERDARLTGAREQLGGVGGVGQVEPEEVAALGPVPASVAGELALERLQHRVAPILEQPAHALEVRLEEPASKELEDRRLGQQRRRDVRGRGELLERRAERRRHDRSSRPGAPARSSSRTTSEYMTFSPPSSSNRLGSGSPSNRTRPYGSSSSTASARSRGELGQAPSPLRARASSRSGSGRSGSCRRRTAPAGCELPLELVHVEPVLVHAALRRTRRRPRRGSSGRS